MTAASAARSPVRGWIAATARGWGWRQVALGVLVGALSATLNGILTISVAVAGIDHAYWLLYHVLQFGLPIVFAVSAADRAVDDHARPMLAYGTAVVAALFLGGWAGGAVVAIPLGLQPGWWQPPLWLSVGQLPPFALGVAAYAAWRSERRSLRRLAAWQLDHARRQQAVSAAQLLALQARVEPGLLFETLQRVAALIGPSTARADALLADLIVLLRALQPAAGAHQSTLGQEIALVDAYARVANLPALREPALQWSHSPEADAAPLAPMVLLPCLRALAGAGARALSVRSERAGARLVIAVQATFPGAAEAHTAADAVGMAELKERLVTVHGEGAAIRFAPGGVPVVVIELPWADRAAAATPASTRLAA